MEAGARSGAARQCPSIAGIIPSVHVLDRRVEYALRVVSGLRGRLFRTCEAPGSRRVTGGECQGIISRRHEERR